MADVFDALTMERCYKKSWTIDEALGHIEASAGGHFDPRLVRLFLSIKDELISIQEKWRKKEQELDV